MIIDRTPAEGAIRISETIDEHLVTRVYYFMTKKEAIESFREESFSLFPDLNNNACPVIIKPSFEEFLILQQIAKDFFQHP